MIRLSFLPHLIAGLLITVVSWNSTSAGDVTVTNHKHGSTVRYSVVLLRGTLSSGQSEFRIENENAPEHAGKVPIAVDKQRFKALVELSPGKNRLHFFGGDIKLAESFELDYQPQTNPHYVRLIWMTDRSGKTEFATPSPDWPQDHESRLRTAALLMQTFTAERMHQLGYGRRTFRLQRDESGQVVVHTWKGPLSKKEYYEMGDSGRWWNNVRQWIDREHPDPLAKNVVLAAYTRKDARTGEMKGHTALGGANLGLFGSASVFSWPRDIESAIDAFHDTSTFDVTKVHDDSVGRSNIWGLASTTIGATLHETGHAFGLPHCTDRFGIMTRGFDHFNRAFTFYNPPSGRNKQRVSFSPNQEAYFAPVSASYLRWSRWFQLDEQPNSDDRPVIKIDKDSDSVKINCAAGIPWVGFHVGGDIHAFREYDAADPPTELEIPLADISKSVGGKTLSRIRAMSSGGLESGLNVQQEK